MVFAASAPLVWWGTSVRANGWIVSLPDSVVIAMMPWATDVSMFIHMHRSIDLSASPWESDPTWRGRWYLRRLNATITRGLDPEVRSMALTLAGSLQIEASVKVIPDALQDESERVQQAALTALGRLAGHYDVSSSEPVLLDLMDHPNPLVRIRVSRAASELGLEGVENRMKFLLRFCDDDRRSIRIEAMKAIGAEDPKDALVAIPVLERRALDLDLVFPNEDRETLTEIEERFHALIALDRLRQFKAFQNAGNTYASLGGYLGFLVDRERGIRVSGLETLLRVSEGDDFSVTLPLLKTMAREDASSEVRVTSLRVAMLIGGEADAHMEESARLILARPKSYRADHLVLMIAMFPHMLEEILLAIDRCVHSPEDEPDVALLSDEVEKNALDGDAAVEHVLTTLERHRNSRIRGGASQALELWTQLHPPRP